MPGGRDVRGRGRRRTRRGRRIRQRARTMGPAAALPAFVLCAMPAILPAQQTAPADVVERALDRHRERAEGIAGFTQEVRFRGLGDRTVTFVFERDTVAGVPVFAPEDRSGQLFPRSGASPRPSRDPMAFLARTGDRAVFGGRETVADRRTVVLEVTDFSGTAVGSGVTASPLLESFTPRILRLHLDEESFLPVRTSFEGVATMRGAERSVRYEVTFRDYRTVDGWTHPFRVEGRVAIELTEEERRGIERQIETLRARLDELPSEQRGSVRAMIEPLEALAGGGLEFAATTVELRVRRVSPG